MKLKKSMKNKTYRDYSIKKLETQKKLSLFDKIFRPFKKK